MPEMQVCLQDMTHLLKVPLFLLLLMTLPFISSAEIEVGTAAPRVTVPDQNGAKVDLGTLYDKGPVLIYFYPKADTPGCTAQACNLRDNFDALKEKGITVVGVSMDSVDDQSKFQKKHELPFTLLADKEGKAVKAFGVPNTMGLAKRQAYLVKDGKIVWRDLAASPRTQTEAVLAAYASLEK